MAEADGPTPPTGSCPVCGATDAYIAPIEGRDVIFVECLNCRVYLASRKAFRHFQYLRWRAEPAGLAKLGQLALALSRRARDSAVRLDYDTWTHLISEADLGS